MEAFLLATQSNQNPGGTPITVSDRATASTGRRTTSRKGGTASTYTCRGLDGRNVYGLRRPGGFGEPL